MNENYDVKDRVHELKQRTPSIPRLQHLPNHENFDVEFSPTGQVLQTTGYTGDPIVLGSKYFSYDDQGRLILEVEVDGASRCKKTTALESSQKGVQTWISRTPSGEEIGRTVEVFEETRRLSLKTFDRNGQLLREKAFEYAENKLFKSDSRYYASDGRFLERHISTYNSEERITTTFGLTADDKPLGDGRYKYEYDAEGRESKVWTFSEWDNVATAVEIYEYTCDKRGNWIERRAFLRFRSESHWLKKITTRQLKYYPSPE